MAKTLGKQQTNTKNRDNLRISKRCKTTALTYRLPTKIIAITAFITVWYLNQEYLPTQADGPTLYLLINSLLAVSKIMGSMNYQITIEHRLLSLNKPSQTELCPSEILLIATRQKTKNSADMGKNTTPTYKLFV